MRVIDAAGELIAWICQLLLPDRFQPSNRFIRFLIVGGVNTAFGYGIFVTCLWIGMHYALAAAISTVLGILFNYKSTGNLVFKSRGSGRLPHFVAVYAIIYVFGVLAIGGMLRLGIHEWLGGLILILPSATLSNILNRRFVFQT